MPIFQPCIEAASSKRGASDDTSLSSGLSTKAKTSSSLSRIDGIQSPSQTLIHQADMDIYIRLPETRRRRAAASSDFYETAHQTRWLSMGFSQNGLMSN